MISRLLVGVARCLFTVAVVLGFGACLCVYGTWRLLRAGFVREPEPELRDLLFALLADITRLAQAVQSKR